MIQSLIRVLVVEDEILILKNIKKKILATASDFVIVGEATNGKKALEMIQQFHPDVIFTDIRMPIMDGLELSRFINEAYPEIFTVIISGYSDFEYAKTALKNRVYDYLLKPIRLEELKRLLSALSTEIKQKRESLQYQYLSDYFSSAVALSPEAHSVFANNPHFLCFMACLGNLHIHNHSTILSHARDMQYASPLWDKILETAGVYRDYYILTQQFDNVYFILINLSEKVPDALIEKIYHSIKKQLPDIPITITYSPALIPFSNLREKRILLRRQLFSSVVLCKSALINADTPKELFPPAILSGSTIQYLQTFIQGCNTSGFCQTMENLFCEWQNKQYPQQWIEKILLQIFTIFQQCLYFSDDDYDQMTHSVFSSLENMKNYQAATCEIISELQNWILLNKSVPAEIDSTIEEMNTYIINHYRETLNISDLAQKYHFNQSYLTRIFKKQKGKSPLKLINDLRISDAKNLLQNTTASVREISELLGFSDQHYFSRIFKDFTGLSPKEFRQQSFSNNS